MQAIQIIMTTDDDTLLPLGDGLYLTLDQAKQKIQIRKYIASLLSPTKICLTPTTEGLAISLQQFQALKRILSNLMPSIVANNDNILTRHYPNEIEPLLLGDNVYLSTICLNGEIKVHIRRCIPMKMLYWTFDVTYEPEKLQPTITGVMLTTQQTIQLFQQMDTIELLLNPLSPPQVPSPSQVSSPTIEMEGITCFQDLFDYVFNDADLSDADQQQQHQQQPETIGQEEEEDEVEIDKEKQDLFNYLFVDAEQPDDNQQPQHQQNIIEQEVVTQHNFYPEPENKKSKTPYLIRTSYNLRNGEK